MSLSEETVRQIVRQVVLRTLGPDGVRAGAPTGELPIERQSTRTAVTESDVLEVPRGGQLPIPAGAMVTPLARDTAQDRRVALVSASVEGASKADAAPRPSVDPAPQGRVIAVGADHGGFALKEELKAYLGELGFQVVDCGTHSTEAVDYPDLAYAVARLVADGRAWRGIVVDGAGIGSCMAANKVPGVRAAMCYDHATAVNSREHNDANVLSLGGTLIGSNLARQIVKVWLDTEFGGGRHARRVDKIKAIERRFAKI